MIHFNFIASNRFELEDFKDISIFINSFPDFQTVVLKNEDELKLLLKLIGIEEFNAQILNGAVFSKYWDLSSFKFPEFNGEQYDQFYIKWIDQITRENSMDEYGNLIFLQGLSRKWNNLDFRLIVKEN